MGRAPCCSKEGLKKGAWTAEEDKKLVSFIRNNNGHGSWRSLPQSAGLQRCGKSCRLRWINYLRPDIKRGNFSLKEEEAITQLHALWGNKWSNIASHLPGRTDNEVKNHWNTHLKKRISSVHRPACKFSRSNNHSCNSNNNNSNVINPIRYNCSHTSSSPSLQRRLPPLIIDQFFVSHMAQWELARLEAEARLAPATSSAPLPKLNTSCSSRASAPMIFSCSSACAFTSSPSTTYSCSSLQECDHALFRDFSELLDMADPAAADAEIADENTSMSSACGVTNQPYGGYNSQDHQCDQYSDELMISGPAAASAYNTMPGSPDVEMTSNLPSLLPAESLLNMMMVMMSPAEPIPACAHHLPAIPDQPCEAATPASSWSCANVFIAALNVGPVMSCPS